ncbi:MULTISPECIES: zinc metalloprotease [unclassified Rathayibacter]|uniref:zinc metalloprotease n=1 Tax=unclassified Rathayibacter TaxID=2609250 RepID=UPI001889EC9F|nr:MULTISPECIES: zinc metalloprotease [unclassified Rathayibacter]MBF4461808.1 zinc metalloprotease [Rathayibacter sp. VKM Ac-2879]MBF4503221.1 zinc metalloprotease [Rathayibacter sp. VKM Ac-2878]
MHPRSFFTSRRGALVGALLLAVTFGAPSLAAGPIPSTTASPSSSPSASEECATNAVSARLRPGSGSTVEPTEDLTPAQMKQVEKNFAAKLTAKGLTKNSNAPGGVITINTYVHVLQNDDGSGGISLDQIKQQMTVLNAAYSGKASATDAKTAFTFRLINADFTNKSAWSSFWAYDDTDKELSTALHKGGLRDLNIFVGHLKGDVLGVANMPWDAGWYGKQDGVRVTTDSMPGGAFGGYNLGDSVVHEVGHWLGLSHTFENGCGGDGDGVADTPAQDSGDNIFSCDENLDTCPAAGLDPVHNFMSYGTDYCMDRFSPGQAKRIGLMYYLYRSGYDRA